MTATATDPDVRDLLRQIREAIHGDNGKVVESATESRQPWPLADAVRAALCELVAATQRKAA